MCISMSYTGLTMLQYVIRIFVAASQEYVNTYSTRRVPIQLGLHKILPLPILYGVRRTQGGSGGGCILRISRAIVLL